MIGFQRLGSYVDLGNFTEKTFATAARASISSLFWEPILKFYFITFLS